MRKIYLLGAALLLSPLFTNAQEECTPHEQLSNNFENGVYNETGGDQILANDFIISANTINFSATSVSVNMLTKEELLSVDLRFYEDADGKPGDELTDDARIGVVPTSQEIVGTAFGYDIREVVIDIDAVDFAETGGVEVIYWMQVSGETESTPSEAGMEVGWETTSEGIIGNFQYFSNESTEQEWTVGDGDGVFTISGECTYIDGCFFPENLAATIVGPTSADITWNEVGDATEWNVEYGPVGYTPGSGTSATATGAPEHTISDFIPGMEYDIYVKSICSDGESGYLGPANIIFDYCEVEVPNGYILPITHVEIAGISNTSNVLSTLGHEYFLDIIATLVPGETYPISIQGNTQVNISSTFVVFIDWNQDYAFNNTDERYEIGMLTNSTGTDGAQTTGIITVPENAVLGSTRMRIIKIFHFTNQYATDACKKILGGQVEDYTVNVEDLESSIKFMDYDFKMGPNPTNDIIQISSTENIQSVKVYNLLGQQILNNQLNVQSPQINMSSLQSGVYLMEVTIKDIKEVFKIVKQ